MPLTLTDVGIWIAGLPYDFVTNEVSLEATADAPEATTFGDAKAHGYRVRAAGGLKSATFSLAGFVNTSYPAQELARFDSLGTEKSVMVVPDGEDPGDVAYVIPVAVTAHSPLQGSIGDLAAFAYAAEGDGRVVRAQVFDVREGVTADNVTARVNLGPILAGETLDVWVHVTRRAGRVQISVESAPNQTTGTATTRGGAAGINTTRLEKYSIVGPVTDEWWQLRYDFSVGSPDFDFASAAAIG